MTWIFSLSPLAHYNVQFSHQVHQDHFIWFILYILHVICILKCFKIDTGRFKMKSCFVHCFKICGLSATLINVNTVTIQYYTDCHSEHSIANNCTSTIINKNSDFPHEMYRNPYTHTENRQQVWITTFFDSEISQNRTGVDLCPESSD